MDWVSDSWLGMVLDVGLGSFCCRQYSQVNDIGHQYLVVDSFPNIMLWLGHVIFRVYTIIRLKYSLDDTVPILQDDSRHHLFLDYLKPLSPRPPIFLSLLLLVFSTLR